MVNVSGSVRVDLLGGTLDLNPINLILENAFTLNLATSLKAKVEISRTENDELVIESLDYGSTFTFKKADFTEKNFRSDHFGPMNFVCQILSHFDVTSGAHIKLRSGSPAGAGLGGSSSMGVTLYKALSEYTNREMDRLVAIETVRAIESRILNSGPAGYQDYYPALHGGVLALKPKNDGVEVEQLFSNELKETLESSLTLVYSGKTRLSGINNWEVYKGFFDKDPKIVEGLGEIAKLSFKAYESIKSKNYQELIELIGKEGSLRETLFSGIVSPEIKDTFDKIKACVPSLGMKVCGAGGGGCFLLTHDASEKEKVASLVKELGNELLEFSVDAPMES